MSTSTNKFSKGTHKSVPARLSAEASCISELGMYTWMKDLEAEKSKRIVYVKTLQGVDRRLVVPVWVCIRNQVFMVYADVVTGTLYAESGECLSSNQLSIVKWGKSIGTKSTEGAKKPTAEEAKKIQRSWASSGLGK